nr:broad-complex core protein isoforms 1/2/3/4/5-like isoform X6 [Procambarus clarkii]
MVRRSKVWRLAKFADGGETEVKCSLCPAVIKYVGNTTNIARHLELKHPLEFAAILDPAQAATSLAHHKQLQQQHHVQHQREKAAICQILAQHREELRRQEKADTKPFVNSPILTTAQLFALYGPSKGLPAPEDRGSSDFVHNNADEVPVAVSPEHFLAETSEREPTPTPPTPTPQKPESYQLRHNNHLTIVLEALARDESFMDVTLTAQGRSLKAHKSVLSAVSPYFRGVLRDNPCQHPIIIMPRDVRFEELFSIVNYIYKGEMTVAAEDLTSLLKTAEILQVSGLAPSDSSATVNPHTDCSATGNARSSSASSSSSSSNLPSVSRTSRLVKTPTHQMATPPARPKSRDSMINPTDFMDVDMTCVKEEVESADDEENEEQISKESSLQTPGNVGKGDQALQQSLSAFSPSHDAGLEQPIASTSSTHDTAPSPLPIKSDPETDINSQANLTTEDPHPFVCPHCQEHHRDRETMITHLRVRHPTKPSFTCGCGRVYTRQMHHQAHVRVCSSSP